MHLSMSLLQVFSPHALSIHTCEGKLFHIKHNCDQIQHTIQLLDQSHKISSFYSWIICGLVGWSISISRVISKLKSNFIGTNHHSFTIVKVKGFSRSNHRRNISILKFTSFLPLALLQRTCPDMSSYTGLIVQCPNSNFFPENHHPLPITQCCACTVVTILLLSRMNAHPFAFFKRFRITTIFPWERIA